MKIYKAEPSRYYRFDDTHSGPLSQILRMGPGAKKPGPNQRMFEEDFADLINYISPARGVLFEIRSTDTSVTNRLLSNVQTRYGPHPIDKAVAELVKEIAQSLVSFGAAYYAVKDNMDNGDTHITSFASIGVANVLGTLIQLVPRRTERHWDRDDEEVPAELRILDATKVMRFGMPKPIKRMLSVQNRTLAIIDLHQSATTAFTQQATHENPNPTTYFDFSIWRDTQERALYRSTRGTGWNARKYNSARRSDFFDCHRLIRFRRNQLRLRDNILGQLSAELSRIGKGYSAEFSLTISGTDALPTVGHLDELESRLTREEAGFSEVIEYCLKR